MSIVPKVAKEHHIDKKQGRIKKARRRPRQKRGDKALKEIKFYQESPRSLIPVALVRRGIRHALHKIKEGGARVTQVAFDMIHAALEEHIVRLFKSAQIMAIHAKRKTLMLEDMRSLDKVCDAIQGREDLSGEPVNPRMSKAHCHSHRKASTEKKEASKEKKKKTKGYKKQKQAIVIVEQPIQTEEEEEEEDSIPNVMEMETEVVSSPPPILDETSQLERNEDDWYLDEEY